MKNFDLTNTKHAQPGFSLIELLVAVTISLFVLAGVGVVMVSSRTSYETQNFNARLQENARFAVQFLSYDLRMAGYWGCATELAAGAPLTVSANSYTSIEGVNVGIGDNLTIQYAGQTATQSYCERRAAKRWISIYGGGFSSAAVGNYDRIAIIKIRLHAIVILQYH